MSRTGRCLVGAGIMLMFMPIPGAADQPPKPALTDALGDPLPPGALARFGTARLRHQDAILQLNATGQHIMSLGADNALVVWEAGTGKEVRRLRVPGNPSSVSAVRMGGRRIRQMEYFAGGVQPTSTSLTPDGTLLAMLDDQKVLLWDTRQNKSVREWELAHPMPRAVGLAPDGKLLACSDLLPETGHALIRLYDAANGREIRQLKLPPQQVPNRLVFSPDGAMLAGVENNEVRLWDVATGKRIRHYQGHQLPVSAIIFAPGGKLLATGSQEAVRIWELASEEEVATIEGKEVGFTAFALSPDFSTLATGCGDNSIRLWKVAGGTEARQFNGHQGLISALAFTPDGKTMISGGMSGSIHTWDMDKSKERSPIVRLGKPRLLNLTDQGVLLAIDDHATVRHLDPVTGRQLRMFSQAKMEPGLAVAVSPDGRLLAQAGIEGGGITVRELETNKELRKLQGDPEMVGILFFSPDCSLLAALGSDMKLRLWRVKTGKEVIRIPVRFQPESHIEMMIMAQVMAGRLQNVMHDPSTAVQLRHVFTPDQKILISVGLDNEVRLWEIATGQQRCQFRINAGGASCLAVAPDGKRLASGGDESVRIWDLATGKLVKGLFGRGGEIGALAYSPGGKILASGSHDGAITFWDPAGGKDLGRFEGHRGAVLALAFSSDGTRLASASNDGTVLIWDAGASPPGKALTPVASSKPSLDELWLQLGRRDRSAYQAVDQMAELAESVTFLKSKQPPAVPVDPKHLAQLIAGLDDARFAAREKAAVALEKLEGQAVPALQKALAIGASAEKDKRLKDILNKLEGPIKSPTSLQALRAVEVLERMGSDTARHVLESWAKGAPEAILTREAGAALTRLDRRTRAAR